MVSVLFYAKVYIKMRNTKDRHIFFIKIPKYDGIFYDIKFTLYYSTLYK